MNSCAQARVNIRVFDKCNVSHGAKSEYEIKVECDNFSFVITRYMIREHYDKSNDNFPIMFQQFLKWDSIVQFYIFFITFP